MSADKLNAKIKQMQSPIVAGLDPRAELLPDYLLKESFALHGENPQGLAAAYTAFCKGLIDALCDIVPAVKPQSAFFEVLGAHGLHALEEAAAYAKKRGMYVIMDAKRGDIGTTMEAYAQSFLGKTRIGDREYAPYDAHALTVNGYLGTDGIAPLLPYCERQEKMIFVLVKTSNPSSGELQDKRIDGESVYARMGKMCEGWGKSSIGESGYSNVGAVVGATYPAQLTELRAALPHTFFLVPGYGAQGANAADIAGAFDENGLGAIVNSSRAMMAAWRKEGCAPQDYAGAARREALRMKQELLDAMS